MNRILRKLIGPILVIGFVSFLSPKSMALSVDTNLLYLTDSLKISSSATNTRIFADFSITIDLTKRGNWVMGWSYGYISITESETETTTFGLTEMGPKLGYYLDRDRHWGLLVTYNLQTKANYQEGASAAEEWRGTSLKAQFGYLAQITETILGGLSINYYSASFSESLTGSTNYSLISNSRATIYPAIQFTYRM